MKTEKEEIYLLIRTEFLGNEFLQLALRRVALDKYFVKK